MFAMTNCGNKEQLLHWLADSLQGQNDMLRHSEDLSPCTCTVYASEHCVAYSALTKCANRCQSNTETVASGCFEYLLGFEETPGVSRGVLTL